MTLHKIDGITELELRSMIAGNANVLSAACNGGHLSRDEFVAIGERLQALTKLLVKILPTPQQKAA